MTTSTTSRITPAVTEIPSEGEALRAQVRNRYGAIAQRVTERAQVAEDSCCEPTCCPEDASETANASGTPAATEAPAANLTSEPITAGLYSDQETQGLPE